MIASHAPWMPSCPPSRSPSPTAALVSNRHRRAIRAVRDRHCPCAAAPRASPGQAVRGAPAPLAWAGREVCSTTRRTVRPRRRSRGCMARSIHSGPRRSAPRPSAAGHLRTPSAPRNPDDAGSLQRVIQCIGQSGYRSSQVRLHRPERDIQIGGDLGSFARPEQCAIDDRLLDWTERFERVLNATLPFALQTQVFRTGLGCVLGGRETADNLWVALAAG